MSSASLPAAGLRQKPGEWWQRAVEYAQRHRRAWPAVAIVAITAAAYHFTLLSLFDFLRLDTPLAYLPLLPLFCIGIAMVTANRYRDAPQPISDRQVDLLVGVPLVVVALLLITLAPVIASTYYWTDRADVLSMALFAAGATVIAYGITWFWRLKASFLFLLLMWPALYLHLMAGLMQSFSNWTNATLAQAVHHLPLGTTLGSQPGLLIVSQPGGTPLQISVGSACSGADSVLGFALIGGAILTTMGGGKGRKLLWWVAGMTLTFAFNIVRLTSILALASAGHATFALGGYHQVIGLILFAVVVIVMMWALLWFGLHTREPVTGGGSRHARQERPWTRRRSVLTGLVLVFTALVALLDHGLQPYAAFDDGSGSPAVKPFATLADSPPSGWQISEEAQYDWATQYFGPDSSWVRYTIARPDSATVTFADVVLTDDKGSLDTYNLQNCFLFHNYDIRTSERIDLGNGVYGLLLNYLDPSTNLRWATVSWAWPVTYRDGTYYERIALTSSPIKGGGTAAPSFQPSSGFQDIFLDLLNGVSGSHNDAGAAAIYNNVDAALQNVGSRLVQRAVRQGV